MIRLQSNNFHPSLSFATCSTSFQLVKPRTFRSVSTILLVIFGLPRPLLLSGIQVSMSADVAPNISASYRRTDVWQLLRILSLVCYLYNFDLQTGLRVAYALVAFDSQFCLRVTRLFHGLWMKELTSLTFSPSKEVASLILAFIPGIFVLVVWCRVWYLVTWLRRLYFSWRSLCQLERRAMSSAE